MNTDISNTVAIVSGEQRRSISDFRTRAARAATGLLGLGLQAGDTVALLMRNDIEFMEATFAVTAIGCYPVPINWHFHATEVAYVLQNSGARVLIAHSDLAAQLQPEVLAKVTVIGVPVTAHLAQAYGLVVEPMAQLNQRESAAPLWGEWLQGFTTHDDNPTNPPGAMLYTGGTTGHPKGVRYQQPTSEQALGMATMRAAVFGHRAGMRTVMCAPLYHSAPFSYTQNVLRLGAHVALLPRFDPEQLLAAIERERATHLYAVPTMFVRLLRLPLEIKQRYDVSSLEWVIHAAAPCAPEIKQQMIDWFGPVIHEAYAATETGWLTHCDSQEALARPGTVGKLVDGATVKIFNDAGEAVADGEIGDIYGRHMSMPNFTYYGQDDKRKAIERNGLITAGDIGYFDQDGYLFLCDRRIDMIISGGVNIYPAEIEAALITMAAIADCAVFGIPNAEFGEQVAAAVQLEVGAVVDGNAIRAALRELIAGYKIPRHIDFVAEIPRLDSGKLLKRKLRDPYWEGHTRTI